MKKNRILFALAGTGCLLVTGSLLLGFDAQAGKPGGGGGGTAPSYTYVSLGTLGLGDGDARAINQAGIVVGNLYGPAGGAAFVVVPKDANNDGQPDTTQSVI